jgi:hypothetical protein
MLAPAPGLAATLYLVSPYANRTPTGNLPREGTIADAVADVPRLFDAGLLPESRWNFSPGDTSTIHWYVMIAIGLAIVGEVFRAGRWNEAIRLNFGGLVISWLPLLYILVVRYRGYHRHHVFLVFPMLVVAAGLLSRDVLSAGFRSLTGTLGLALMTPWLLLQWRCASFDWDQDKKGLFCSTKTVAMRLPAAAHVISDTNYSAIGVLFWRPDIVLRSTDGGGRTMTYNPPDADWLKSVPMDPLVREECHSAPDRVFVVTTSGFSGTPLVSKCAPRDATYYVATREAYEAWGVFGIDCACVDRQE